MYVEPCCIDRQIPEMLRTTPFCFFHTNGDCTVYKFLNSVSCLADGERVLLMVIPEVDIPFLRLLRHYFVQDWYQGVILLTQKAQTELIRTELEGYTDLVAHGCKHSVVDGFFAVIGSDCSVCVQGPLLLEKDFTFCQYAAYKGKNKDLLESAIEAILPKVRLSNLIEPKSPRIKEILMGKL